jgi:P27 family predicted phage terminase small subunit
MAGRRPTPTHLKLIKGTARSGRINPKEAKVSVTLGKPDAPDFLTSEARQEWDEQCETLFRIGLLTRIDKAALAAYCQAYGRWRRAEEVLAKMANHDETTKGFMIRTIAGNTIQNPLVGSANKAMSDMMRYAVELGLTPSSRSRINAEPTTSDDPAHKYLS